MLLKKKNHISADRIKAVVIGHAVADALGVPVEFRSRESLDPAPVTDMMGYGTYPYPAGTWSDDTSNGTVLETEKIKKIYKELSEEL